MKQYFESIFNLGYIQYKGKGTSEGYHVQNSIRNLTKDIGSIASSFGMQTESSVGIGRWSAVPWIRVYFSDLSPSAQDGVYIVYLFSASGKSAFITLNQGTTDSSSEKRNRIRKKIQEKVNPRNFLKNSGTLSFGDNKNYGAAAIFYKEYKADSLPSEEEMLEDLKDLLEIYKECRDKALLSEKNPPDYDNSIQGTESENSNNNNIKNDIIKGFNISDFEEKEPSKRYILSLLAKPFVILTGNSGTGKTRIATRFAQYLEKKNDAGIKNHLLIPVGADWTDNTKILGYYNPLANNGGGKYEKTDIFNFIESASANPDIPFFLILDEMNLSHVERYFSDFLSKMELVDYKNSEQKTYFDISGYGLLEFPKNLFITGTVNIDETTYMFSPKVLDRANVIEFIPSQEDVLSNFESDSSEENIETAEPGVAEGFLKLAREVRKSKTLPEGEQGKSKEILSGISTVLEGSGFEFAFRTAKEIRLYLNAAAMLAQNEGKTLSDGDYVKLMDEQLLQKILLKIHGNRSQIADLLKKLSEFTESNSLIESNKKIKRMQRQLETSQFASFI